VLQQVYPTNYIKTATGWDDNIQPISSCDQNTVNANNLPTFTHLDPGANSDANALMVNIIDGGTSEYDPPAMPPDVHDIAQLFTSRAEIW
jgi:hypothetical protein